MPAGVRSDHHDNAWSLPSLHDDGGGCAAEPLLRQLVPDVADHDVYLCGADGWMDAAERAVLAAGVQRDAIHLERFSW